MATLDITATLIALVCGLKESIVLINKNGEIIYASDPAEELAQSGPLKGRKIFDFLVGPHDKTERWLQSLDGSYIEDAKVTLKAHGVAFPARVRLAVWPTGEGEFVILATVSDSSFVEERRRDLIRKTLTIEYLSRSRKIREGKLHDAVYEILSLSSRSVGVERVNAWIFNYEAKELECIGSYDARKDQMVPQENLPSIIIPRYFEAFRSRRIIVSKDARNDPETTELNSCYLVPNDIYSLMDIPVRSEGEIIGVICFEQVGQKREWSVRDQKYGFIAAQMISLAIETHKRKILDRELEKSLKQQQLLLLESNHRISNNLSMVISLMRLQLDRCRDDYHRALMQDALSRMYSIVNLHNLLTSSDNRVDFKVYVDKLMEELNRSLLIPGKSIRIIFNVEPVDLPASLAVSLGLIITEIATNAFKHAFGGSDSGFVKVELKTADNRGMLRISDSGRGSSGRSEASGMGMDIVKGIAEHIGGEIHASTEAGYMLEVDFPLE